MFCLGNVFPEKTERKKKKVYVEILKMQLNM